MNVCGRSECHTTAGCAHRGPNGELCYWPETGRVTRSSWLHVDARPLREFSDDEIVAEYHLRMLRKLGDQRVSVSLTSHP